MGVSWQAGLRHRAGWLTLAVWLLLPGAVSAETRVQAWPVGARELTANAADLRLLFDAVIKRIETRFVNAQRLKDVDWRTRAEAKWPEIAQATNIGAAVRAINALLDELKTSHTQLYTPADVEYYILGDVLNIGGRMREFWGGPVVMAGIGIFTISSEGRHHVSAVLEGSPADLAGVRRGDELVSVDGQAFTPVESFRNKAGNNVTLITRRVRNGEEQRYLLPVVLMQPTVAFDRAAMSSARVIDYAGKRIGYVHLWQMRDPELLAKALAEIDGPRRDAQRRQHRDGVHPQMPLDALIIDNRTKIGGSADAARKYLETLAEPNGGPIQFGDRDGKIVNRTFRNFAGRSVMLIDEGTRSAAEIFAAGFRNLKLGKLIGSRTAGAVSGGAGEILPHGLLLYIAVQTVTMDGQTLEGSGVPPDIAVGRALPYSNGADPVLEAALKHLAGEEITQPK